MLYTNPKYDISDRLIKKLGYVPGETIEVEKDDKGGGKDSGRGSGRDAGRGGNMNTRDNSRGGASGMQRAGGSRVK